MVDIAVVPELTAVAGAAVSDCHSAAVEARGRSEHFRRRSRHRRTCRAAACGWNCNCARYAGGHRADPGDVISVAPSGIPVGELAEPVVDAKRRGRAHHRCRGDRPSNCCQLAPSRRCRRGAPEGPPQSWHSVLLSPREPTLIIAIRLLRGHRTSVNPWERQNLCEIDQQRQTCSICPALHPVSVAPRRTPKAFLARRSLAEIGRIRRGACDGQRCSAD